MLLRPFTEDALWRALEASPSEGESSFGSPMVAFEGGNLYCCGKRLPLSQREAQVFSLRTKLAKIKKQILALPGAPKANRLSLHLEVHGMR